MSQSQHNFAYTSVSKPYLGLKLPGKTTEEFPGRHYYRFFNDGKECYFIKKGIWYTRIEKGKWIEPIFTGVNYGEHADFEMNISPDGNKIIFNSVMRPVPEKYKNIGVQIWVYYKNFLFEIVTNLS